MGEPVADRLDEEWRAISELGATLDEQDWKTPTALPGWAVQDCVSHLIGIERMLLGDPAPEVDISHLDYVANPFAAAMEGWVEERRLRPGAEVLAEFDETTDRRRAQIAGLTEDDWAEPGWSPVGEVPYRDFMVVRVFDCWMHEQDMRRAVGRPGHLTGPVVALAMQRFKAALGFVVGKKAEAPDGSSVVIHTPGGEVTDWAVVVDGRAAVVDELPVNPTVRLTVPFASFVALGGGRWSATEVRDAGGLEIEGDRALGERILASLAFTP